MNIVDVYHSLNLPSCKELHNRVFFMKLWSSCWMELIRNFGILDEWSLLRNCVVLGERSLYETPEFWMDGVYIKLWSSRWMEFITKLRIVLGERSLCNSWVLDGWSLYKKLWSSGWMEFITKLRSSRWREFVWNSWVLDGCSLYKTLEFWMNGVYYETAEFKVKGVCMQLLSSGCIEII